MNLCFKAFAVREVSEDTYKFTQVDWVHPQEVHENYLNDFMWCIFEDASYNAFMSDPTYDWITVVAYGMDGNAFVACDYERRHPSSEDRYYGNDIADEIARLRV